MKKLAKVIKFPSKKEIEKINYDKKISVKWLTFIIEV